MFHNFKAIRNWFSTHPWVLVTLVFTVVFSATLWPLISLSRMPQWDASDLSFPNFTYIVDSFREGRIPFWDPYTKSGYPFHAEPFQPILNPFLWLIALSPIGTFFGFILFWMIHWWIAGFGMIWLSSLFGATVWGGLIAAVSFAFSGFFVGHAEHTPFIVTICWLPWIFGFADQGIIKNKIGYFFLAAFALGMSTLGGYPPLAAFSGFALGLWLILRHPQFWKRSLFGLSIVASVVVIIALPSIHAFLTEAIGHTDRTKALDPTYANFGAPFLPASMVSLVFPFSVFMMHDWLASEISMADAYCGILTLPFIFYWWIRGERKNQWWWVCFFLFMFILSLGGRAGLRTLLYYIFPPMQYIRFSSVFRAFWILALALAAGLGFSYLSRDLIKNKNETVLEFKKIFKKYLVFLAVVALLFVSIQFFTKGKVFLLSAFLPAGIIIPFCFYALKKAKNIPLVLSILVMVDMAAHVHINHGSVWDSANPLIEVERNHQFITTKLGEPNARKSPKEINHSSIIQVQKNANTWGYTTMVVADYDNLGLSEYLSVLKAPFRFWLTPNVQNSGDLQSENRVLSKSSVDKPVPVFFNPAVVAPNGKNIDVIPGTFGEVKTILYSPEKIELAVNVPGTENVALASTERWGKSWQAQVDGVLAPVYLANHHFRGLILTPGQHKITWFYQPPYWKILAFCSALVLWGSLFFGLILVRRKHADAT